jgi:hemerythrin-like domain-containing protein
MIFTYPARCFSRGCVTNHKIFSCLPETFFKSLVLATRPSPPGKFGEELPLISPTEILSREHAVIERLMIAMESMIARAIDDPAIDLHPVNHAAITIDRFGALHHMVDEERFLFPRFREAGVAVPLIDALQAQHDRGRQMVGRIIELTRPGRIDDLGLRNEVIELCMSFIIMYRAHAAWEETVAFPAFYEIVSRDYVDDAGRQMREEERGLMSDAGLRKLMDNVGQIEAAAGTADLARFTPLRTAERHTI